MTSIVLNTIEDCIKSIVQHNFNFKIDNSDVVIIKSISNQITKNIGLTDKQHALMIAKLSKYKNQFIEKGFVNFDNSLACVNIPLRTVNREKSITLHDTSPINNSFAKKWFKVKFPFSKNTINIIDNCVKQIDNKSYYHQKGSNEHFFKFNEIIVDLVISKFLDKNFLIDIEIMEFYQDIQSVKHNEIPLIPTIFKNELINFTDSAVKFIENEIGKINDKNIFKFYDRRLRFGITKLTVPVIDNLYGKIISRESTEFVVDPNINEFDNLVNCVIELDRLPLLVLVDEDCALEQVSKIYNAFKNYIPAREQSVLFRLENNIDRNFNDFIHENKFNNWLDSTIKIVYINKNKLNKILLNTEWSPICALSMSSNRLHSNVQTYAFDKCDLILYYSKELPLNYRKLTYV